MTHGKQIMIRIPEGSDIQGRLKDACHALKMPYHEFLNTVLAELGFPSTKPKLRTVKKQMTFSGEDKDIYDMQQKIEALEGKLNDLTAKLEKFIETQTSQQPGPVAESTPTTKGEKNEECENNFGEIERGIFAPLDNIW